MARLSIDAEHVTGRTRIVSLEASGDGVVDELVHGYPVRGYSEEVCVSVPRSVNE